MRSISSRTDSMMRATALEEEREAIEDLAPARPALGRSFGALAESGLVGEDKVGAAIFTKELDRAERRRDPRRAGVHHPCADNSHVRHDVEVFARAPEARVVLGPEAGLFAAADAKVLRVLDEHPVVVAWQIPLRALCGVGPRGENDSQCHAGEAALDDGGGVNDGTCGHRLLSGGASPSRPARKWPRRSSRRSQSARRAAIQRSTLRMAAGSIRQIRTRPDLAERTRPPRSSARR